MMYEAGTGVQRDRARAVQLYTRAAEHGIAAARAHLAELGQRFTGTSRPIEDTGMRDFQQAQQLLLTRNAAEMAHAVELFRRAAEQHNSLAAYDLGYCYEHGMGVSADRVQAYAWYQRAAAEAKNADLRLIAATGAHNLESQLTQAQPFPTDAARR